MANVTHAGGIVINNKNQVMLVCNKLGYWTFPRGHIEKDEDILSAAKREIKEETGIENLDLIKNLGSYERRRLNEPDKIMIIEMFLFKTKQKNTKSQDKQNPQAKWFKKEKIINTLTAPGDKDFFSSIQKHLET